MSNDQNCSEPRIDRRQAIKIAAGATALGAVLGVRVESADASAGDDRVMMKLEFMDGKRRIDQINIPAAVSKRLMAGDLATIKFEWHTLKVGDKESQKLVSHGLDPKLIDAMKKLQDG